MACRQGSVHKGDVLAIRTPADPGEYASDLRNTDAVFGGVEAIVPGGRRCLKSATAALP